MSNGSKILLVEDDKFLSRVLKSRLEKEGFVVEQAFNGKEGMEKIRETRPNLVILDLVMPKMSGFDFLQEVSTDPQISDIPVIVVSQLGQESDIAKARQLGVIDYYVKVQTSLDDLVEKLKGMVKGS